MRLHLHLKTHDLDATRHFYTALFDRAPAVEKPDYIKWSIEHPPLNLAVSLQAADRPTGLDHTGIEFTDMAELVAMQQRLDAARLISHPEQNTTCCYARSDKVWSQDPQGIQWESFVTHGPADPVSRQAPTQDGPAPCCDATTPQGLCCPPKAHLEVGAPCCG